MRRVQRNEELFAPATGVLNPEGREPTAATGACPPVQDTMTEKHWASRTCRRGCGARGGGVAESGTEHRRRHGRRALDRGSAVTHGQSAEVAP